jgi:peptide/nickel transport system permease protein
LTSYALKRVLTAIPLLLGVATIVFLLLHLAPGDPANLYITRGMSPETVEAIRRNMGLDGPFLVRYLRWLSALVRGDLGFSFTAGMPVRDRILAALPNTLLLASAAMALSFALGILMGVVQAVRQYSLLDSVLSGAALFFYSMPSFWLAIMLILVFNVYAGSVWHWPLTFPASGVMGPTHDLLGPWAQLQDRLMHLALPVTSLTLVLTAGIGRYVRASMLEVIHQDYIRTARAKGLSESRVILKHALRNALIPVVTLFGLYFPMLLSGTVFIEVVFGWPGMGRLMVDSIVRRDFPVVLAGAVLYGGMVVVGNLLSDLLYGVVDPRIREGRTP